MLCLESGYEIGSKPTKCPEIHLNLWESGNEVLLDIGLMLDASYAASKIELLFPWPNNIGNVEGLLNRIATPVAVAGIFNESWSIIQNQKTVGAVVSESVGNAPIFSMVEASLKTEIYADNAHIVSIDIDALKKSASALDTKSPRIYTRFRVRNVPKSFYCVGIGQRDKGLVSSWQSTEIIDFRLNVRRGAPPALESPERRFMAFSKVHLFLMRDRGYDLVFEDAYFKSCRSLEDEVFWAEYSTDTLREPKITQKRALANIKSSLGYQWSKKQTRTQDNVDFVNEFSILARFKKTEVSIWQFLIIALLLGALGNALWDGIKWAKDGVVSASCERIAKNREATNNAGCSFFCENLSTDLNNRQR